MDSFSIAADDAFKAARANKGRVFMKGSGDGTSGAERLRTDIIKSLQHTPKFKLNRDAPVFTIGSCFARNIEMYLVSTGIECLTSECVIPGELYELEGFGARNGALSAYTPGSMLDTLTLFKRDAFLDVGMLDVGNGQYCDMLLSGLKFMDKIQAQAIRQLLLDTYANLKRAETVIITFGYTEAWWDKLDGIFVNRPPAGNMRLNKRADRFSFTNMTADHTIQTVEKIAQEVREQTDGRAKIVITVSPVPLTSTFTAEDVITANDFSKATLLSAVRGVTAKYNDCDYFPSFQLVNHAPRASCFDDDGVHVNLDYVRRIVQRFESEYF